MIGWRRLAVALIVLCASTAVGECASALWSAQDARPALVQALFDRGAEYYREREFGAAIADFTDVIRLSPEVAEAYLNRGAAYFALSRYELAIEDFTKVIEINPDFAEAFRYRASAHAHRHELLKAVSDYNAALALDPDDRAARAGRCQARAEGGYDAGAAMLDCSASLRLDPSDPNLLRSRGILEMQFSQLPNAIADFSASLAAKPIAAGTYFCRGVARLRTGDSAGAADIALAEGLDPGVAGRYSGIGITPPALPPPVSHMRARRKHAFHVIPVATARHPIP